MKTKVKIGAVMFMMCILVFGITYAIMYLVKPTIKTSTLESNRLQAQNLVSSVSIIDSMSFGTPHALGDGYLESNPNWRDEGTNHFVWAYTAAGGRDVYCIEKGGSIRIAGLPSPDELEEILAGNPNGTLSNECDEGYVGQESFSNWNCEEHITAMPDLAYILSEPGRDSNGEDIDKYVLRRLSESSEEDPGENYIEPVQQVIDQTAKYFRIHALYEAYKREYVTNGTVNLSEGTVKDNYATIEDSDYFDVYLSHMGDEYGYGAWNEWKRRGWPDLDIDETINRPYSDSERYRGASWDGVMIPSDKAYSFRESYNSWRNYVIWNSEKYREWIEWVNDTIRTLTYEEYYEYYRYIVEEKGGEDNFEVVGKNGGYEVIDTEFNENGEYPSWDMMQGMGVARLELGQSSFLLYPNKNEEPLERGPTEDAPQNDLGEGVALYYVNDYGTILYKYHYGDNINDALKQYAIWVRYGKGDGISMNTEGISFVQAIGYYGMASELLKEGEDYEDFGAAIDANANSGDPERESNLIGVVNKTERGLIQIANKKEDTDNDGQEDTDYLTVGPFNVEYIEGIGSNGIHFGGISDMWVEGYNIKGELIKERIEVERFILDADVSDSEINGAENETDYFTPNTTTKSFTDTTAQVYPRSGEWFYVKIKNPNSQIESENVEDYVQKIDVKVEFKWMRATATVCILQGGQDQIVYDTCSDETTYTEEGEADGYVCHWTHKIQKFNIPSQYIIDAWGNRYLYKQVVSLFEDDYNDDDDDDDLFEITMRLGGYVWQDALTGKEQLANGVRRTADNDIPLKNVRVTLYEYVNGNSKEAVLIVDSNEADISEAEKMHRVNSTMTDENGYYQFNGLDTSKKYFVVFEYNGQRYLPTDYLKVGDEQRDSISAMLPVYNTDPWYETSKALESETVRNSYDQDRFGEIRAYERNYRSSNNLGETDLGEYNSAYVQLDLMGYVLNDNGTYEQTNPQLVDGYKFDANGLETTEFSEGIISVKIREYIQANGKYPDSVEEIKEVYSQIVGEYPNDDELWNKLQFIEDCKMQAYTTSMNSLNNPLNGTDLQLDLYPVYDDVVVQPILTEEEMNYIASVYKPNADFVQVYDGWVERGSLTFIRLVDGSIDQIEAIRYNGIYDGQFYINCGLWRRQEADMTLRKDVYKAVLKINDKTEVYDYAKRDNLVNDGDANGVNNAAGQDNQSYWDINTRISNYAEYYGKSYSDDEVPGYKREIYGTDWGFNTSEGIGIGHEGDAFEVYVTYKIIVRNQSMTTLTQINEVVDYYDQDYTFKPNLSWVMFKDEDNDPPPTLNEEQYKEMMERPQEEMDTVLATENIDGAKDAKVTLDESKYDYEKDFGEEYQKLYVRGLEQFENGEAKKLVSGECAYIYLTFQVKKDGENVRLDEESDPKENLAEINGFSTYYANNTTLPNYGVKGSGDHAGLLDRDSVPGSLEAEDLNPENPEERMEKAFEDDADRAPSLRIMIDEEAVRTINGVVWEDERNHEVEGALIGDGRREENETPVAGVTVELVEKRPGGKEYIWYQTTTNENGEYSFSNYIPGDYVVRFKYGDTYATALSSTQTTGIGEGNGGRNIVAYNGQDFKSTIYQVDINQSDLGNTDEFNRYQGYINTETQNGSAKYNEADIHTEDNDENSSAEDSSEENSEVNYATEDTFGYDIFALDEARLENNNYSDAKDIYTTEDWTNDEIYIMNGDTFEQDTGYTIQGRQTVIEYSDGVTEDDNGVKNYKAEVLASPYVTPSYNGEPYDSEMTDLYNELVRETQMTAETGMIVVEFEYDRQETDGLTTDGENDISNGSDRYLDGNDVNGKYAIRGIDFGLTERPKAQLEIDKSIKNVQVTLANGSILFDIVEAANNALWQDHQEYSIDEEKNSNGIYDTYYGEDNRHRYSFRELELMGEDGIVKKTDKGLIQLTIDEELMHGATIQITYTVKITNVGEIDYVDDETKDFYYMGDTSGTTVSTTTANQVVDYVQNNLQFDPNNDANMDESGQGVNARDGWEVITVQDLTNQQDVNQDLVNKRLESGQTNRKLSAFNTIAHTENFGSDNLVPGQETTREIVLSQVITPQNTDDDLTYNNMVEIVKTSNTVGRRMAYSVVGNQDPSLSDASEVDANVAERVVILPPFGEVRIYYILGAVVAVMLIGGIILIRRKVLKGKDKTE